MQSERNGQTVPDNVSYLGRQADLTVSLSDLLCRSRRWSREWVLVILPPSLGEVYLMRFGFFLDAAHVPHLVTPELPGDITRRTSIVVITQTCGGERRPGRSRPVDMVDSGHPVDRQPRKASACSVTGSAMNQSGTCLLVWTMHDTSRQGTPPSAWILYTGRSVIKESRLSISFVSLVSSSGHPFGESACKRHRAGT